MLGGLTVMQIACHDAQQKIARAIEGLQEELAGLVQRSSAASQTMETAQTLEALAQVRALLAVAMNECS
jgi:hypothetical protein